MAIDPESPLGKVLRDAAASTTAILTEGQSIVVDHDQIGQKDRLWVNEARTVLVRMWASGTIEVATREAPDHTWGPPVLLEEQK